MQKIYILFLVLSLTTSIQVNAKCIRDIIAAGLSFDSVTYNGDLNGVGLATLASNSGIGVRSSWIIYCPKRRLELQPYIRFRRYTFDDAKTQAIWGGIEDTLNLLSLGIEARKFKRLWGKNFEITADVELREEQAFGIEYPADTTQSPTIYTDRYMNLKMMGGLRYFAWHQGKRDVTAVLKLGLVKGFDGDSKLGVIYGISGEYYQKLGHRTSGKVDLYYDHYSQKYGEFAMGRTELGLRTNIVFRF